MYVYIYMYVCVYLYRQTHSPLDPAPKRLASGPYQTSGAILDIYTCICVYMPICIYICREREREKYILFTYRYL